MQLDTVVPLDGKVRRRQNRTRDTLLRESARLFISKGFENTSVEDILTAAGIARSSFYRFFSNREDVLANIIRPVFEQGSVELDQISARSGRDLMAGIFQVYLGLWDRSPNAVRVSARIGGVHFALFEDVHREFRTRLIRLVEKAASSGILLNNNADFSARLIARVAIPTLDVYSGDPNQARLFMTTMEGLLLKPLVKK